VGSILDGTLLAPDAAVAHQMKRQKETMAAEVAALQDRMLDRDRQLADLHRRLEAPAKKKRFR